MKISDYLRAIALTVLGLEQVKAPDSEEKLAFVNDLDDVVRQRDVEYRTWYAGDSDELLNLYNYDAMITFRTERWYWKNKRSYYWSVSSKENTIKRSHSGFPKAIIDTLVYILGVPTVQVEDPDAQKRLEGILEDNDFWNIYEKEQIPMTLVSGWGAYKITWDEELYGAVPVINWCGALDCRTYKKSGRVVGMSFLDWYENAKGERFLVAENRVRPPKKGVGGKSDVNVFRVAGDNLSPCSISEIDANVSERCAWEGLPCLFAVPCSFFDDNLHGYDGRSVFEGKLDVFDDIDQAISIASNTDRRVTPIETFDVNYADRDKDGVPKLPSFFERRYVAVHGQKNSIGEMDGSNPVTVTQPNLNADQHMQLIEFLMRVAISGVLSPSTMGLDVAKKDNADAIREKDKTTVFVRNAIAKKEKRILEDLFNQVLMADEFLRTGRITVEDYHVTVTFDEFSDQSFENKIQTMSTVLANDGISPEQYVNKIYGMTLSEEEKAAEIDWLTKKHQPQAAPEDDFGGMGGVDEGMGGLDSVLAGGEEPTSGEE